MLSDDQKAKKRENQRRYRARHIDRLREKDRIKSAKWRAENPDRHRKQLRDTYAKKREEYLHKKKLYYQKTRKKSDKTEIGRFKDREKKARRRSVYAEGAVTLEQWRNICASFDNHCAYCGFEPEILEMDHVVPLARGGRHIASNIVPACKPCNSSKGAR